MKSSIIEEAVSLPVEKRTELIDILTRSLNPPADKNIDRLWIKEAERRFRDIKKGKVKAISAEKVFDEIRKRLIK